MLLDAVKNRMFKLLSHQKVVLCDSGSISAVMGDFKNNIVDQLNFDYIHYYQAGLKLFISQFKGLKKRCHNLQLLFV